MVFVDFIIFDSFEVGYQIRMFDYEGYEFSGVFFDVEEFQIIFFNEVLKSRMGGDVNMMIVCFF